MRGPFLRVPIAIIMLYIGVCIGAQYLQTAIRAQGRGMIVGHVDMQPSDEFKGLGMLSSCEPETLNCSQLSRSAVCFQSSPCRYIAYTREGFLYITTLRHKYTPYSYTDPLGFIFNATEQTSP